MDPNPEVRAVVRLGGFKIFMIRSSTWRYIVRSGLDQCLVNSRALRLLPRLVPLVGSPPPRWPPTPGSQTATLSLVALITSMSTKAKPRAPLTSPILTIGSRRTRKRRLVGSPHKRSTLANISTPPRTGRVSRPTSGNRSIMPRCAFPHALPLHSKSRSILSAVPHSFPRLLSRATRGGTGTTTAASSPSQARTAIPPSFSLIPIPNH